MRKLSMGVVLAAVLAYGIPAVAGTANDPEITDPVGDANVVSAASDQQLDTRPASIDGADLRAIWLETSFVKNKVLDSETGQVVRVQHVPTGLLLNIRTQAPMHPTPHDLTMFYRVRPQVRDADGDFTCPIFRFYLEVPPGGSGGSASVNCAGPGSIAGEVSFEGDVATLAFPYTTGPIQDWLPVGATLSSFSEISSYVRTPVVFVQQVVIDEGNDGGRSFTIGQDVPPDIDCASQPDHPDCQA